MMLVCQCASASQQHCVRAPLISSAHNSIVHFQVYVGMNAIMATPAMSALIRGRKLYGKPNKAFLPYKGNHCPTRATMICGAVSIRKTSVAGC